MKKAALLAFFHIIIASVFSSTTFLSVTVIDENASVINSKLDLTDSNLNDESALITKFKLLVSFFASGYFVSRSSFAMGSLIMCFSNHLHLRRKFKVAILIS